MPILRNRVMQVVFINDFKSCEISDQIFCNVFIFKNKKSKQVMTWRHCKIKLFSDTILNGVSNDPEAYLELGQTSTRGLFAKIVNYFYEKAPSYMFDLF